MKITKLQRETMFRVFCATERGAWYRASGSGERVTLASLYRRGALIRRAWRGVAGSADAANEYRIKPSLMRDEKDAPDCNCGKPESDPIHWLGDGAAPRGQHRPTSRSPLTRIEDVP